MRKKLLLLLSLFAMMTFGTANAQTNPFFGDNKRQVGFHIGAYGMDSGIIVPPPFRPVPFQLLHIQYSMPTSFLDFPARYSLNVGQTIGWGKKYGWHWDQFTIPIIFISEDVALLHGETWYTGVGMGAGMQAQQNERIGSKLIFQFKLFGGFRLTESLRGEVFMMHMSNGNTADANNSYAWYGVGLTYSF